MAKRNLTDHKILCRKGYVELGITSFAELAKVYGVDRRTIAKWAEEENWEKQREQVLVTPAEISQRVMRTLSRMVDEIEEMQRNGKAVSPLSIKQMYEYSQMVERLNKRFDARGTAIAFSERFIKFCRQHNRSKEIMPLLKDIMPDFLREVASEE